MCSKYQFNVFEFDIFSHSYNTMYLCGTLVMGYVQCIFPRLYFKKEVGNETLLVPVNGNQNRKIHKNSNLSLHCKCKE